MKKIVIKLTKADNDHGADGCATCRKRASEVLPAFLEYVKETGDYEYLTVAFRDMICDLAHLHRQIATGTDDKNIGFYEICAGAIEDAERELEDEKKWRKSLKCKHRHARIKTPTPRGGKRIWYCPDCDFNIQSDTNPGKA